MAEGTVEITEDQAKSFLTEKGFKIRTAEEETSYLESVRSEAEKKGYKAHADLSDDAVKTLTGIDKEASEKSTDYAKRAFDEFAKKSKSLKEELDQLKEKGVDGNAVSDELKSRVSSLEKKLKEQNDAHAAELSEVNGKYFLNGIKSKYKGLVAEEVKPNINKDVPEVFRDSSIKAIENDFFSTYQPVEIEGQLLFKKDGETVTSDQDGKPVSMKELIIQMHKPMFAEQRQQNGNGSNGGQGGGQGGGNQGGGSQINLPENVKTQTGVFSWLQAKDGGNLNVGTKEFDERYAELSKGLPIGSNGAE